VISSQDIPSLVTISKNLITDQTYTYLQKKLNTAAVGFNVALGLGVADNNSSAVLGSIGGFANQRVTGDVQWVAPTVAGGEEIGVIARCLSLESTLPGPSYYYARVDAGIAKLTRVLAGVFTNLSQAAFALPIGTIGTISLEAVGSQLTAVFTAAGVPGSPLTLSAVDANITTGGLMGVRSLTSSIWCSSLIMEQLL
jgi:hypothetical protein